MTDAEVETASALSLPETPSAEEQIAIIEQSVLADAIGEMPFDIEVVDDFLRSGSALKNSVPAIIYNCMQEKTPEERLTRLKQLFPAAGKGLIIEGQRYAAAWNENGMEIALGDATYGNLVKVMLTWEQVDARVQQLLEGGQFASQETLDSVPEQAYREHAQQLLYLYRDMTHDAQNALFSGYDITANSRGFDEERDSISALLHNPNDLAVIIQRLSDLNEQEKQGGDIMNAGRYRLNEVASNLPILARPTHFFTAQPGFMPASYPQFITGEQIDRFFTDGGPIMQTRLTLYSYYLNHDDAKERADYIRQLYGTGGRYPAVRGDDSLSASYTPKGITLTLNGLSQPDDRVDIKWPAAARRIDLLMQSDRYLTPRDYAQMPDFQRDYLAGSVVVFYSHLPDGMTTPFPGTEVYDQLRAVAAMLDDPEQVLMLIESMTDVVAATPADDENHDFRLKTLADVSDYTDGVYTIFPKKPVVTHGEQLSMEALFDAMERENLTYQDDGEPPGQAQPESATSEQTQPELAVGMTFTVDGRQFSVEQIAALSRDVTLSDLTYQQTNGYPIFRVEKYETVVDWLESAEQARQDDLIERFMPNEESPAQDTPATSESEEPASESTAEPDESIIPITAAPVNQERHNFRITDDDLGAGGLKTKFRMNMDAIYMLKTLENENRLATAEEQEVLSRYVGWGGIPQAFDPDNREWSGEYAEVRAALTDEEYRAARGSTLNAFYTSPTVIKAMYEALGNMGLTGGNVLEPSCGVGNFMGLVPDNMSGLRMYGVELDSVTGRIARQLYQRNQIAIQGFEETEFPDSFFDVVIGNVPFGSYRVPDRKYDRYNFLIHDYFLARSIDLLRPGGVMAVVTSSGTMDKQNDSVRRYIAARADLLGAIRLPDNAFLRNANTGVVTDILFLQKRESLAVDMPDWVRLDTTEDGFTLNAYFVRHPEMILGELSTENTQYASQAMTVRPIEGAVLADQLKEAVSHIHGQIVPFELPDTDLAELPETIPADPNVRNFSYTVIDDTVYFRENSVMTPVALSVTAAGRVKGMVELRNATQALLDAQLEESTDDQIAALQRDLSERYDRFTAAYGLISGAANRRAFSQDSSYCMLAALEVTDEEGHLVRKADIFTRRTIQRPVPVESVDTASEALALSIGEKAAVDLGYMAGLCSKSEEEIIAELRGVIFRNPETGRWETNDEYLSGNVRQKLDLARDAARSDDAFAVNVEYLQRVQPKDLDASEIEVRLGATWIEPHYLDDFMREVFHTPRWKAGYAIQAQYSDVSGVWNITGKSQDSGNPMTNSTYGTDRVNGYKLLEDALNLKNTKIYDIVRDADGEHRVLNKQQTILAQQKQDMIREAFKEWIFKDLARREALCAKYNRLFNAIRPREYDGSHIRFVGMTPAITLMPHQKNAVGHILYGGNTLLAHCVGAGKTFSMIAAGMESRRLGLSQKNLYVVPNHLTEQWGADFLRLYPGAHILVATKKDFEPANRKKFCSRIATGDYDAVIIGHSQFEKIPLSRARQADMIQRQIDDITDAIETQKSQRSENFTVKQMERTRKGLEARLQRLNDQSRKDDVVTFEQLGVDRLFVDESHNFKNLFLYTKMQNVAGIQQTDAQKSSDMFMKCRYLDSITGGRGVVFATGTPVSNSMVELYTIMRYLQYDLLQRMDMVHFDSWASAFGDTVTAIELAPEGTGYRSKTRFARFYNLPELISMFREAADVQTADMLKLPVPEAEYVNEALKPSDIQKDMVEGFSERAEKVRSGAVDPKADNMLKITNDGRKCALDQRLVNELHGDYPDSKVNMCVRNALKVWQEGQGKKTTQLIFCDLSTPKGDGQFNIYDDLREKLTEQGVPREEISFIHEADTETKKAELFARVRSGQVRILIGSTPKLGAGTNVQDRLAALHHL
ncbi:MAG: N-6 DNA methylase, partial [Clostridia bacterium]|nr:N-6 DNA methylase [Clostridia bacterium]